MRRREVGGGSPAEGLLVIQTLVIRVVAMVMEKRVHPQDPRVPSSKRQQHCLERILNLEPPPAVSLVQEALLPSLYSYPLALSKHHFLKRGCPSPSYQSG